MRSVGLINDNNQRMKALDYYSSISAAAQFEGIGFGTVDAGERACSFLWPCCIET